MMLLRATSCCLYIFFSVCRENNVLYEAEVILYLVCLLHAVILKNINVVEYLVLGLYAGLTTIGIIFLNWYAVLPYKFVLF